MNSPVRIDFASALRAYLALGLRILSPQRRVLEEIRARWARIGNKDNWMASRYFELTRAPEEAQQVDDRTWADLEFPKIFASLDTTLTRLGSQCLYRQLRTYQQDPQSSAARFEKLRREAAVREKIQLSLCTLQADSFAGMVEYLFGEALPLRLRWRPLLFLWCALCILVAPGVLFFSLPPVFWIAVVIVNVAVIYGLAPRVHQHAEALRGCYALVRAGDALAALHPDVSVPQLKELADLSAGRARVRASFAWFSLFASGPLAGLGVWLNFLFLAELVAYVRSIGSFRELRPQLRSIYGLVGSLDADIAVASFLERVPAHCRPAVISAATIRIENGYHPLMSRPVPNSLALDHRSALITGSNMAGKTTFIKMVGTNIVLGRTLGICLASSATIPARRVMACIRTEHSIESGKSRYFAELETLLGFLHYAERGEGGVLLIDEPFSGTNTLERIAAARAVLAALSRGPQVLATTHDVELQELLREHFQLFHFREDPEVEGFFDYQLREGVCAEGNALRLLGKIGFPQAVLDEAVTLLASRLRQMGKHCA